MKSNLVIFFKNTLISLGVIFETNKKYSTIISESGSNISINHRQIIYSWPANQLLTTQQIPDYLLKKRAYINKLIDELDINIIYELCDKDTPYSIKSLSTMFLESPDDHWQLVALIIKIKNEKHLFRETKKFIIARNFANVKIIKEKEAKLALNIILKKLEKNWINDLEQGKKPILLKEDIAHFNKFTNRLFNFAKNPYSHPETNYFCNLLDYQLTNDNFIFEYKLAKILLSAGCKTSWGHILTSKTPFLSTTNDDLLAEEVTKIIATQTKLTQKPPSQYLDETHLLAYSVDDALTKDFDDAISFEDGKDSSFIRLHITDVSHFITPNSLIFERASEFFASFYSPKKIFNMLPIPLAEEALALKANHQRLVLTFAWELDENYYEKSFKIYHSIIKIKENLTYDKLNILLKKSNHFWGKIDHFCLLKTEERKKNDALFIARKEVSLDITNPDHIKISKVREDTPASLLVQEISIQANKQAGKFLKEHAKTAIYRAQPAITKRKISSQNGSIFDKLIIPPAIVTTGPAAHHGLGIKQYAQATSPLRRFCDLVNQSLISYHLNKQIVPWSDHQLFDWAKRSAEQSSLYRTIEKDLLTHWKYKYLAQQIGNIFALKLVRPLSGGVSLFNIIQLQMIVKLTIEPTEQEFNAKIDAVDISCHHLKISKIE
ncbi:MAG: RNB domain-containing ribonuclease [SAR324 cluster bacterium]|nr:RNB domain-containing ribonuclease [SAR324 cluster bacterium]